MAAARCARRTLVALALLLAFLLLVDPASGLFGFGKKKKETDEAAAKAGLEESLAAAELSRKKKDSKKAAEPPKKPKPAAAVSARKVVKEREIVERQNLTITYDVHNAGPLSAKTVTVDDSANLAGLDIVEGSPVLTFEDLEAFTRVKQTVVVVATSERVIPGSKAKVIWTVVDPESGEESSDEGLSTSSPTIEVLTWSNYRRAKKMYGKEYSLFALGVLPPVLLPLLVWLALSATNERRYWVKKRR